MSTLTRGRRYRTGWATLLAGLLISTWAMESADASAIRSELLEQPVYYASHGTIGEPGGEAPEYLDFQGVNAPSGGPAPAGVFYMPGAFSLGGFQVRGLPAGESRTFDALPFSITLDIFADPFVSQVTSRIRVDGVLDGELTTEPGKGLLASVTSVSQVGTPIGVPPFRVEDLQILAPQFIQPAGGLPAITTPIYGYVGAQVPEPTALVTLGLGGLALAAHSWRRRRQAASGGPAPADPSTVA